MERVNYSIDECIFEGVRSRVLRARGADDRPVVIKQLRALYPPPEALAGLAREFDITRAAAGPGVIEAVELLAEDRTVSLVLEDFGAESLATTIAIGRLPVQDVLHVGLQVTDALAGLHRRHIVHKDISPANIVWNRATGVAKLIDFGMSQVLERETVAVRPVSGFEGTPAYLSPEQTGRMNRAVDWRADFYSLGATLYELLVGHPPFVTDDPLAMVHAHLAKAPVPPHVADPTVSEQVSNIVMLLLEKRAEDRYQSAGGLRADLERCSTQLAAEGRIDRFALRTTDRDERLCIPQRLYGRQAEVDALVAAFEGAAQGRARLLLVSGYSGIGKTSLVHEVHRALVGRAARFVEGKFDQFNRGTPYDSFLQALTDLVQVVLTEDATASDAWKARVLDAIGDSGQVLLDVIPELEHLIGPQPPVADLQPAEARNRFQNLITRFVSAAASPEHPLVIFLDDLQWADLPTIELIAKLAGDRDCRNLLLIGAYRDNEVGPTHPLWIAIEQMRSGGADVDRIDLGPLGEEDVLALVADTVGDAPGRVRLALLCHTKTGGNAFFLRRFLAGLFDAGLLTFDAAARQWSWDLAAIQAQAITDNVVEYLSREIAQLEPPARRALEVASCVGDTFDLEAVAFALGTTRKQALDDLRGALGAELIHPAREGFWFVEGVDETSTNFSYRFAHDRIRQAAHALLGADDAARVHLELGRRLVEQLDDVATDPRLFEVVEHLNAAGPIDDEMADTVEMIDTIATLNLAAGRRAFTSAAFQAAHAFFTRALACSGPDPWQNHYERTRAIHLEGARAAYLSGDQQIMDALVEDALNHARSEIDRVEALEVRIYALVAAQRLAEAVDTALDALAQLGVHLPRQPSEADVEAAVGGTLALLQKWSADDIVGLALIDDPRVAAAQRIENLVMSPAYLAVPTLLPVLAADIVQSSLNNGICAASPYGFAVFALVLSAGNVIDVAYETGQVARKMLDRFPDRSVHPRTLHVFFNLVKPFTDPLRELVDDQQQVFQIGMDTGDLEYAAWALHSIAANAVYAGLPLAPLSETTARYLDVLAHHQQLPALACTTPFAQLVRNLMGEADDPTRLIGPTYDERTHLAEMIDANFRGAAFIVTALGTFSRYLFGAHAEAVEFADAGFEFADGAASTYHQVWWHQYRSLAVLAGLAAGSAPDLSTIDASLEQLRLWNHFSPVNHEHRVLLLEAEIARVDGRRGEAADLYDRAIAAARTGGFLNEEALANELSGRFHLERGSDTAARAYLLEASYGYTRWGAVAKAAALTSTHRSLLHGLGAAAGDSGASATASPTARSTAHTQAGSEVSAELDLATLFKAASLIASENRLDDLLRRVLDVAIENAGATKGYLIVDADGEQVVGAARDADANDLVDPGTPISECADVLTGVVSYVARTGQHVVLSDAHEDARWGGAPGTDADSPTSVLCAPIVHQEVTSGIVYLGNDLVAGAFTPARINVLELLSRQAAISMENARYTEELRSHRDHLEELVRDRTRELDRALGELRDANAVLDKLSLTDALTGLPNRRHFDQSFEQEWGRAQREHRVLSVLMIDVDWFKRYNDHYGHQQGDECLRRIASALSSNALRPTDLVARYGGEEFAAILPGVDAEGAQRVCRAMLEAVRELGLPHEASPGLDHVTISIGAAVAVPGHTTPAALLALADRSLYRAKDQGRNRFATDG